MRRTRDEEVTEIAEEAYRGAYRLLVDHRDLLDGIAERLLANEVIEHDEIRGIMDGERMRPAPAPGEAGAHRDRPPAGDRAAALVTKPPDPEQR